MLGAGTDKWLSWLAHPDQWWRLTGQRLLVERQERGLVPALRAMAAEHENRYARMHALNTLEGLGSLHDEDLRGAMNDDWSGVREHAVRLAERNPELLPEMIERLSDEDLFVALQATLSVGWHDTAGARDGLVQLLDARGESRWFRRAVATATTSLPESVLLILDEL